MLIYMCLFGIRLEQELKKHQALMKQQEKQRKIEQEKEEVRQKALEQREVRYIL